jgi:uncharacterized membrane protein YhaH (DUF805 family)
MSFGEAVASCFRNYANARGRAARPEFWYFFLFMALVFLGFLALLAAAGGFSGTRRDAVPGTAVLVAGIFTLVWLGLLLPYLMVLIRRLHDTGRSGAWFFLWFIPFVGPFVVLFLLASPGEPAENQWGPAPITPGSGRPAAVPEWVPKGPAPAPGGEEPQDAAFRVCPFCSEWVSRTASVCRYCRSELWERTPADAGTDGALYGCPDCGRLTQASEKGTCPNCGTTLSPNDRFS